MNEAKLTESIGSHVVRERAKKGHAIGQTKYSYARIFIREDGEEGGEKDGLSTRGVSCMNLPWCGDLVLECVSHSSC